MKLISETTIAIVYINLDFTLEIEKRNVEVKRRNTIINAFLSYVDGSQINS